MRVAIIGGEKSLVDGNWLRRFEEHGLEIVAHHHDKNRAKIALIPHSAEGVIVIRDMTRHRMSEPAKTEADKRGLPYAAVPRKWSKAEPILRMQGILPEATDNVMAPAEDRHDLVVTYIVAARAEGRIPKIDECRGALRLAFGKKASLGTEEYNRLCNVAAAQQPLAGETGSSPFLEAYEWAEALLQERPDLLLDTNDFVRQVIALVPGLDKSCVRIEAEKAAEATRQKWSNDPESIHTAIFGWIKYWFTKWNKGEKDFPHTRKVGIAAKNIFGVVHRSETYRAARVAVLGEWATNLLELGPAQMLLNKKRSGCDLRALLTEGKVKGFQVQPDNVQRSGRWYTSVEAIDEYLQATAPKAKPKPLVETPAPAPVPALAAPTPKITATDLLDQIQMAVTESIKAAVKDINVDVDLTGIRGRLDSIENTMLSIADNLVRLTDEVSKLNERRAELAFGAAIEAVVDGVSKRGVAISLNPTPVSRT